MNKKEKRSLLVLMLLLFTLVSLITLTFGRKYTAVVILNKKITNIEQLSIEEEKNNHVKIIDKYMKDNKLYIRVKYLNKGKSRIYINANKDEYNYFDMVLLHSHRLGYITEEYYFGDYRGDIVIPISIIIFDLYLIILLYKKYRRDIKESLYQYKNIFNLGLIIFLTIALINNILNLINYRGLMNTITSTLTIVTLFSLFVVPIAIITFIFVTISNIRLMKREGFTWKNMLGTILGLLCIFIPFIPDALNNYLQQATFVDVHNLTLIWPYLQLFVEVFIYGTVTYIETILLSTIIIGIKSAKHKPDYNKDYIIILGCMIKKDGTLTNLLKSRVDKAIEFAKEQKEKTNKDIIFIPSGGQGSDEIISEGEAMSNYLLKQGIDKKHILVENKSTNTDENIKYSYKLIKKKNANVAFSTTNYHVFRAGCIAFNNGYNIEGIGAKTKSYFWINAFIREFIAELVLEKKKHIIVTIFIYLIVILLIFLYYLCNVL